MYWSKDDGSHIDAIMQILSLVRHASELFLGIGNLATHFEHGKPVNLFPQPPHIPRGNRLLSPYLRRPTVIFRHESV